MTAPLVPPRTTVKKPIPGIFLLPNLFTTAALFAGFYAMVVCIGGDFEAAILAILIAIVLDGADGRIARLTNTQSLFGAEYDSLADVVSFGIAPALLIYQWSLVNLDQLGWLIAFFYATATALRLARFNSQLSVAKKDYFQGLPCPAAAASVASVVWLLIEQQISGAQGIPLVLLVTVITAALMVSNVRFYSFKTMHLRGRISFAALLAIVLLFVFIFSNPPLTLCLLFTGYVLSGPVLTLLAIRKRRAGRQRAWQSRQ